MPTFAPCPPSVEKLAQSILKQFDCYEPVIKAKVKIDFVFAFAESDKDGFPVGPAIKHRGVRALGVCKKMSLKDRAKGHGDVEILLDGDWWEDAEEDQQRALLDHELFHIVVKMDKDIGKPILDNLGRPQIGMRHHDFEFGWFSLIAMRHGQASQECVQAKGIMDSAGQFYWPDIFKTLNKAA